MKLASILLTTTILLGLLPTATTADGWLLTPPSLSSFLDETEDFLPTPFLRRSHSFPQHQIVDDAERFQVTLDLAGIPDDAIHISVENNGMTLLVHGRRQVQNENYRYESSFAQRFSLSPDVRVDEMVATRRPADGKLIITAPKDATRGRPSREIPIQHLDEIESGLSSSSSSSLPALPDNSNNNSNNKESFSAFVSSEQEKAASAAFVSPSTTTTTTSSTSEQPQHQDGETTTTTTAAATAFTNKNDSAFVTDLRR